MTFVTVSGYNARMATTRKPKRQPCPSCGGIFQRGSYVFRVLIGGTVKQRVCQTCASKAVPVLASDSASRCQHCGDNLARFCGACITAVMTEATGLDIVPALVKQTHKKRRRKARS